MPLALEARTQLYIRWEFQSILNSCLIYTLVLDVEGTGQSQGTGQCTVEGTGQSQGTGESHHQNPLSESMWFKLVLCTP